MGSRVQALVLPLCVGGATRRNNGKSVFVLGAKKTTEISAEENLCKNVC